MANGEDAESKGFEVELTGYFGEKLQYSFGYAHIEAEIKDAFAVQEAGAFGVVLECIPESLATDITNKISEEHTELIKSRISLNKFGKPEDVANTIAFLCSNLSDYITGETIHVNGGMYFS